MSRSRPFPLPRRPVALAIGGLLLLAPAAYACRPAAPAQVDVYDRTERRSLETHAHRGRLYVVGRPGNEYAVRIRNCSGERILAVVSVDGVNVVTGETASPEQSGYVIEPWGYVNIEGWRKDLERTAAFYFTDPGDAYAARTGRPDDLGVIGVAVFRERPPPPQAFEEKIAKAPAPSARQESSAEARSAAEADGAALPALGTGHGRREWSPATRVEFERASRWPAQRVAIRYDRYENLQAQGVLPRVTPRREPDPFPGALGFVPDP
jgi:hypothetical protein